MSGCVAISAKSSWTPAGWIFDNTLEDAADLLQDRDARLARLVRDALEGFEYLDVSSWTSMEMSSLLQAVVAARAQRVRRGAAAFAKPEFFPGFVEEVDRFIGLLEADPRMRGREGGSPSPGALRPPQT